MLKHQPIMWLPLQPILKSFCFNNCWTCFLFTGVVIFIYNCDICRRYCKYFYEYIGVSCFEEKITSYYFLLVLCINLAVSELF